MFYDVLHSMEVEDIDSNHRRHDLLFILSSIVGLFGPSFSSSSNQSLYCSHSLYDVESLTNQVVVCDTELCMRFYSWFEVLVFRKEGSFLSLFPRGGSVPSIQVASGSYAGSFCILML